MTGAEVSPDSLDDVRPDSATVEYERNKQLDMIEDYVLYGKKFVSWVNLNSKPVWNTLPRTVPVPVLNPFSSDIVDIFKTIEYFCTGLVQNNV